MLVIEVRTSVFPKAFIELTLGLSNVLKVALLTFYQVYEIFWVARYGVGDFSSFVCCKKSIAWFVWLSRRKKQVKCLTCSSCHVPSDYVLFSNKVMLTFFQACSISCRSCSRHFEAIYPRFVKSYFAMSLPYVPSHSPYPQPLPPQVLCVLIDLR